MRKLSLSGAGVFALILTPHVALAQDPTGAGDAGEAVGEPAPDAGLGEIVVTAQKRAEDLQDVPIAITAISAEALDTFHVTNNAQLAALTPGLHFTQSTIAAQPWIRGIGNASGVPGNEPAVATYVDGVYRPSPVSAWFSYNGIENIQVLKGPQGTLFGRNATGGVVSITTKRPDFDPSAEVSIGYGNYDTLSGSVYVTGGITDNLAMDFSVFMSDQMNGFGRDVQRNTDVFENEMFSARTKWYLELGDSTSATFTADYDRTASDQSIALAIVPGTTSFSGFTHVGGFYDTNSVIEQYGVQKQGGVALTLEHDLDWGVLTSISSYRKLRSTGHQNADPVGYNFSIYIEAHQETITQEINLQSAPDSDLSWIVGLYYFDDKAGDLPTINFGTLFGNPTGGTLTFAEQQTRSYAAYGQTTIPLFNDVGHLTLGLRYTQDERSIDGYRQRSAGNFALEGVPVALVFNPAIPKSTDSGKLTYRVAYDHQITDDFLGYVSYSRGFKSGNYFVTAPTAAPTFPQTLDAFEVGFKSEWADNRLRINGAAFYYLFDDLQVKSIVNGVSLDANAAAAEYYGADLEIDALIAAGLQLKGSFSWVHAEYTEYPTAPLLIVLPNGDVRNNGFGDVSGNRVAYVDPLSASLALQYTTDTSIGEVNFGGNISYHDGYYGDVQNLSRQQSHTLVGASIGWTSTDDVWEIDVWGQNLLNEQYYIAFPVSNFVGQVYSPASPRTFGVTVSRHFR